ncbi:hypothetical protein CFIMG_003677RA [Ceratocystis fimbriata CBS 114723]|uniref:G-patch domain-containing protein n=1 Tax=Ceratocystis fimbriata CBS 114723 TaxID=1035309 RepID=A0A2C5X1L1_9PEZI|nr:hypothetical protein CFIMG_003677RA [Ceratocystis fimbriata CBS 114723]
MSSQSPAKPAGLSLYADLLEPEPGASNATDSNAAAKKKAADSALRFQPIRRTAPTKQKPKSVFSAPVPAPNAPNSATPAQSVAAPTTASSTSASTTQAPPVRSRLSDWAPSKADEWAYGTGEKRQRGGRKNKNKRRNHEQRETDWEDVYDPSRPTNVDEYLKSDERIGEIREWKDILYGHRKSYSRSVSPSSGSRSDLSSDEGRDQRPGLGARIAPPPGLNFAPPPEPQEIPMDISGDDVYARRQAMSQGQKPDPSAPTPTLVPASASVGVVASSAPVRYAHVQRDNDSNDPEEGEDWDDDPRPALGLGHSSTANDDDNYDDANIGAPRANRPGQSGFAGRMMAKYGWTKGSGLGAESDGITSALSVAVEKRRKRPDAEGGGWAEPAGSRNKVLGGQRNNGDSGQFGKMSDVVVLRGMLDGMEDLAHEIELGLGQEIGEECGEKYGRVERLYIDQASRRVFIKFTNQISALRAVSELNGRMFSGNTIKPAYYDSEKFEACIYD